MAATFPGRGWSLVVDPNLIDVTSEHATPNEQWRHTDSHSHEHHYDHGYPTLDYVIDAEHWCDGSEGLGPHDPHTAVDEAHYECKLCRETIEPRMDPPYTPKSIVGSISATLTGVRSDGVTVAVSAIEDEVNEIRGVYEDAPAADRVVRRILDEAPQERILSMQLG